MEVVIFTEGSAKIGFGHITRSLSLAQALERLGGKVKVVIGGDLLAYRFAKAHNFENIELYPSLEQASLPAGQRAFIDSYQAPLQFYERVALGYEKKLYLDDYFRLNYPEGAILNYIPALEVPPIYRNRELLWGEKFHLLRAPFWEVPPKRVAQRVEKVLITFGGDDIRNLTPKVLKLLLENFRNLKFSVVVGGGFKNVSLLEEIERANPQRVKLYRNLNASQMRELMLQSDLAVSAGGQTLFELARVGVPTVAFEVAKNQRNNLKGFSKLGFIDGFLLWSESWQEQLLEKIENLFPKERREKISQRGRSLIDGKGALRVAKYLLTP